MQQRYICALAVAGGLGAWLSASGDADPRPTATGPTTRGAPACALALGQRFAYHGRSQTAMRLDMGPLARKASLTGDSAGVAASAAQAVDVDRSWRLDLAVVDARPDRSTVLLARLSDVKTTARAGAAAPPEDLSAPLLLQVDARCRLERFAWRADADLVAARAQQAILAQLGFEYPEAGGPRRYESAHFDVIGRYRATTMVVGHGVAARPTRYTQVFANHDGARPAQQLVATVEQGLLRAQGSGDAWFERLSTSHRVGYTIDGAGIGHVEDSLEVARAPVDLAWRVAVNVADPGWRWGLLLDQPSSEPAKVAADSDGQQMTVPDALATLAAMLEGGTTPAERVDFLVRWLRANPEAVAGLLTRIKAGELDGESRLRALLFHALAAANTAATRAGLQEIFGSDAFAYGYRVDAAQVMTLLDPPPADLLPGLIAAATDGPDSFGRGSMKLALGMFASKHAARHPEWAAQAHDALRETLGSADGVDERIQALQAIGNAGSDALIDAVDPYLEDAEPAVRRHAADALRNTAADAALPRLEAAYLSDDDPSVRAQALATAGEIVMRDGAPPPAAFRDAVVEALPDAEDGELHRMAAFLGQAAQAGDAVAAEALRDQLAAELAADAQDAGRLAALGRHAAPRWRAR